jgi:hypothetical protein
VVIRGRLLPAVIVYEHTKHHGFHDDYRLLDHAPLVGYRYRMEQIYPDNPGEVEL